MNKKVYEKVLDLNKTYIPLIKHAKSCQTILKNKNIDSKYLWANNHYEEYRKNFICESYPIPVIEIKGIGDIGFNIGSCFYEGYFSKERLLSFDFNLLRRFDTLTMYGENNYLEDIYNSQMNNADIKELIYGSNETNIAINFGFKYKDLERIIDTLIKLTSC